MIRAFVAFDLDAPTLDALGRMSVALKGCAPKKALPKWTHRDQMHITERFKLVAPDYLQDQITIDDPGVLEKPVTYTLAYKRMPDYEMVEFVCDNNREYVDEKGVVRLKLRDR